MEKIIDILNNSTQIKYIEFNDEKCTASRFIINNYDYILKITSFKCLLKMICKHCNPNLLLIHKLHSYALNNHHDDIKIHNLVNYCIVKYHATISILHPLMINTLMYRNIFRLAVKYNNVDIVQYFHENNFIKINDDNSYVLLALTYKSVEVIKYLISINKYHPDKDVISYVCVYDDIELYELLLVNCEKSLLIENIIIYNSLHLLRHCAFTKDDFKLCSFNVYTYVCANEYIEMIEYMIEILDVNEFELIGDPLKYLVECSRISILEYLHIKLGLTGTDFGNNVYKFSIVNGNIKMIEYLYDTYKIKFTSDDLRLACEHKKQDIIKYIHNCGCYCGIWLFIKTYLGI